LAQGLTDILRTARGTGFPFRRLTQRSATGTSQRTIPYHAKQVRTKLLVLADFIVTLRCRWRSTID